jgi:MoxR-like ATPase
LQQYIVALVRATRVRKDVLMGASPRASITLFQLARGLALYDGETFVTPDHIQEIAVDVLAHRLALEPQARYGGITGSDIVRDILQTIPVPV